MSAKRTTSERPARRLRLRLRSDRGAVDPILSITSIAVSGLVSAAIIGALIMVISLGTNYVEEQTVSTTASQAQSAFAEDAQNSSSVAFAGDQAVLFTELKSDASAVSTPRGRPYTCRVSEWKISGATLQNRVAFTNDASANPCAAITAADRVLLTTLPIIGPTASEAPSFQSKNMAGKALKFNAAGTQIASPDTNDGAYWTANEWVSGVPKTVSFTGRVDLPISGSRDVKLSGRTFIAPGDLGLPAQWAPEPDPGVTTFPVDAVTNVTYTRGTTGVKWGGERESLIVKWDKSTCGAYPVVYNVVWASKSAGAPSFNQNIGPNFNDTNSVELAPIPNGAVGDVKITASCPPTIPDLEGVYTKLGHQTDTPTPAITGITQPSPHIHAVSFLPVSSLPTRYNVFGREATVPAGTWSLTVRPQSAAATPTTSLTQNVTWPANSTYGRTYDYKVQGRVLSFGTGSPWSAVKQAFVPVPPPGAATTITPRPSALTSYDRVNPGCVVGTVVQYRSQQSINDKPMGSFGPWSTTTVVSTGALEGYKVSVVVEARCIANNVPSASVVTAKKTWVTNVYSPTGNINVTIPSQQRNFTWSALTCGPGTTSTLYRWAGFNTDGVATSGPTLTWSASRPRIGFNAGEGRTVDITVHAICRGLYADSKPTAGSDREIYTIFATGQPRLYGNFPTDFWFDAVGTCPAGSKLYSAATWTKGNGAAGIVNWGGPTGRSSKTRIENGNVTRYNAHSHCKSSYSGREGPERKVSAYYGSTPNRPTVLVSRSSVPIGTWFTASVSSGACASHGMRSRFYLGTGLTDRGLTWGSSAGMSDYWNSSGTRTYYGAVRCMDYTGNEGNRSGSSSASIRVYTPAPSNPSWVSATGSQTGTSGGGWMFAYATVTAGGSSYASGYVTQNRVKTISGGLTGWGKNSCVNNASKYQIRAYASGPGGTSGWTTSGWMSVGSLRHGQKVC